MRTYGGSEPCRSCGERRSRVFHEAPRVPLHCCQLIESREAALSAPMGSLRLAFCEACGFVQNNAFDPLLIDYSEGYEDSQAFSQRFLAFARGLADRLTQTYELRGGQVLEVGCGKGDFLALLCEVADAHGLGIDPSYPPGRQRDEARGRLEFIADYYTRSDRERRFDLFCCRHTLEHLPEVGEFVSMVADGMIASPGSVAFFEVPDVTRVLEELAFWDLYYEHCSYFSPGSLARLFRRCGFQVLRVAREFDEQYVMLDVRRGDPEAVPREDEEDDLARLSAAVERFTQAIPPFLDGWRKKLGDLRERGRKAVLWGAGSKAVGFLTTLEVAEEIEYVVDINPHKHDMHLAGTGHRIVAPAFLQEYKPDLVIVMNPVYTDEIRGELSAMRLEPEVMAL